jgi:uncharacterized protein YnzC (UPF0291/DUF896 family)
MKTISAEEYKKKYGEVSYTQLAGQSNTKKAQSPSFMSRVGSDIKERGATINRAIAGTDEFAGQSALRRGTQATATAFGALSNTAFEALPENNIVTARSGLQDLGDKVGKTFSALTDKVSDAKALQDWVTKNPKAVEALEEILGTTASAGAISGEILGAKGTAVGATKVANATPGAISTVARTATDNVIKPALGVAGDIAGGVKSTASNMVNPERIMQRVARIPKNAQANFEKAAGESVGKYLNKRDIYGSTEQISNQLYNRFSASREAADSALAKLPGTYKARPVDTALDELLSRETRVSSPGALSPDIKRVQELWSKNKSGGLSMSEINEVKRIYERNIRLDFVKQNLPEGVARSTNIDNALRQWQFSKAEQLGLKNLRDINRETRLAKQLLDDIGKESSGSAGNNLMSLTDAVLIAGGDPATIGTFIGKRILGSKRLSSYAAKKLYRGEKVGKTEATFTEPKPGLEEFMKKTDENIRKKFVPEDASPWGLSDSYSERVKKK